jgi:hypothetical protein
MSVAYAKTDAPRFAQSIRDSLARADYAKDFTPTLDAQLEADSGLLEALTGSTATEREMDYEEFRNVVKGIILQDSDVSHFSDPFTIGREAYTALDRLSSDDFVSEVGEDRFVAAELPFVKMLQAGIRDALDSAERINFPQPHPLGEAL